MRHGIHKSWYPADKNGKQQLKHEIKYVYDKRQGFEYKWYEHGVILEISLYRDNIWIYSESFDENGVLKYKIYNEDPNVHPNILIRVWYSAPERIVTGLSYTALYICVGFSALYYFISYPFRLIIRRIRHNHS
jgi:hypothetical protein